MISPKQHLSDLIAKQKIPHALLLSGPYGSGQREAALAFAKELVQTHKSVENHPDIHIFSPEGKAGLHPISSIRELTSDVTLVPFEAKWKVFILFEAEKMLPTSSHALLKTLEEPASQTVIILVSHHPERLLPTVLSRCYQIEFTQTAYVYENPTLFSFLSRQGEGDKLQELEQEDSDTLFEAIMLWYRDRHLLEIPGGESYLHFPKQLQLLKMTPLIPLEQIEKGVKLARLAYERSTKLSTCLEMFLLKIHL